MQQIINTFASEYGWSKEQILDLYPAEIELLTKEMAEKKDIEHRQLTLTIASAASVPHMKRGDAKRFYDDIGSKIRQYQKANDSAVDKSKLHSEIERLKNIVIQ